MVFTAAVLSCAWIPAHAQTAGTGLQQSLAVSLGAFNESRRDDADSPLTFAGTGLAERIDYVRAHAGRRWYFSLDGASATVTPLASGVSGQHNEEFGAYALGAGTDWRLRGSSGHAGVFALGVQLGATLTVTRHFYASDDLTEQTFDLGIITLAPVARWSRPFGDGLFTATLALPLLAWVDHPYADVRYANQFVQFHFVPLTRFHQADGVLSYEFNLHSRYGVTAAYRVDAVELDELQPVRRFTQSLTVAVVRRFGSLP
ncbi:MAG: hypothetical protein ACREN6_00590 [Gemmatimonadaceae bacterium]